MKDKILKEITLLRENNTFRLIVVLLALLSGRLVSRIPYVNLVLSSELTPFLLILVLFWFWQMPFQKILLLGLGLFLPTAILFLVAQPDYAETLGNYTFGLLIVGVIGYLKKLE